MTDARVTAENSSDAFDEIAASLDYPMYLVTTADGEERSGCLVGFLTQSSIDPRRLIVCISKANHTFRVSEHAPALVVHVLRSDQLPLAKLFGEHTGDDVDKFKGIAWRAGPEGAPIIDGCDWISGRVIERFDVGDHVGHLLDVTDAGREHASAAQLGYQATKSLEPGHDA